MALHINSILPNELLLKIFSYVSTQDLIWNVSNVCVQWNNLAKDQVAWKERIFVCDGVGKADDTVRILSQVPFLRKFHMRNTDCDEKGKDILSALFHHCSILDTLVLDDVLVDIYIIIKNSIKKFKQLQVLILDPEFSFKRRRLGVFSLRNCSRNLSEAFEKPTQLRKLIIPSASRLTGTHLMSIAENCSFLEELDITGARCISDSDMISFIEKRKDTLVVLKVAGSNLTDNFSSKLSVCKGLKTLGILDCYLMESMCSIGQLQLKSLSLHSTKIPSSHVSKYFSEENGASLLELQLSDSTTVDDSVIEAIALNCVLLKSLSLSECPSVTDNGVKLILNHCQSLRKLRLCKMCLKGDFFDFVPLDGSLKYLCVDIGQRNMLPIDKYSFHKVKLELC